MPLNVPNVLTMTRLVGSLLIWPILALEEPSWTWVVVGTPVYVFLCLTDCLDGYIARRWNQRTPFGEWLDPFADKVLVAVTIGALFVYHEFFGLVAIFMVLALCREIFIIIARECLRQVGEALPTIWAARAKTWVQMTGLGVLIFGDALDALLPVISDHLVTVRVMGELIFIAGTLLGFHSAWQYLRKVFAIFTRTEPVRRS